jgi:hypothetical protein
MVVVLFPVGAFGSTVEYCLRQFSNELTKVVATIAPADGSMHTFEKEFHPLTIDQFVQSKHDNFEIVTPVYPGRDYLSPRQTLDHLTEMFDDDQKVLVIYFSSLKMAELNQLFCYYKVPDHLDWVMKDKQTAWNMHYNSWTDMQSYELREALSFYIDQQIYHLEVEKNKNKNWLYVTSNDLLYDFKITILDIMKYFQLTVDPSENINEFYASWLAKQKYILDEFEQIEQIMLSLNSDTDHSWNKLSIMGEAIIQSRLRHAGSEIACYQLNQFPTTTYELQKTILPKESK